MTEFSYFQRQTKEVLQREGVEDDKAKAERILAQCADKPIRKIGSTADIPVGRYPPLERRVPTEHYWDYR